MSYWKLGFLLWTEAKDSPQPIRDSLARATGPRLRWALGSSGPVHRCGLKCLNTTFPHPMGCKSGPSADQNAFGRNRYNRGASQQQQPHKQCQPVQALTPLLTRRKRMPFLKSVSRFGPPGVWNSRINAIHKATPQRPCFDHHHKTLLFNRSLDHLHLSMPHWQSIPCNWYLSIYNLWARTSQRRVLS